MKKPKKLIDFEKQFPGVTICKFGNEWICPELKKEMKK